jgi:hypothetical protein
MSDVSPILSLPLIQPAQAQKHVTHNEAIRLLDLLVQGVALTQGTNAPPASPAEGDRHLVGSAPTGDWAGQAGKLAFREDGLWQFLTPQNGWSFHVLAEDKTYTRIDGTWTAPSGGGGGGPEFAAIGVGTAVDPGNPLSVAAASSLLNHAGAGHRLALNKAAAAETASLLFQTGFSGRAEMGTSGSDNFGINVSANGATFLPALTAFAGTGHVSLPQGVLANGFTLRDPADPTKAAVFDLAPLAPGATATLTMPATSGTIAVLPGAQTFSGAKTFAGGFTVSGATGTLGTATETASYGVGTGATASGATKTVDLGTGGEAGSTTVVNVGPAAAGAGGSLVVNTATVTFAASVTAVGMAQATLSAARAGIGGAAADATNRLSVNSPAVLLNHAGAGMEATVNKAAAGNDAALAFKTGFSTRALAGLLGNDDLSLKVSADGTAFADALVADRTTGRVRFPGGIALDPQAGDPASPANGWLWLNGTTGQLRARIGGQTRILNTADIPWLTPQAGDHVLTTTGAGGAPTGTLAGVADRMDIFPFSPRGNVTVDRLAVNCTTAVAGSTVKIVVYSADANGRPDALLVETGTLDTSTTGNKSATVSMTFHRGTVYWVGVRHSANATLSAWVTNATPDINGGGIATTARKVLRRSLAYATPAPATWVYAAGETNVGPGIAIWLRAA